MTFDFFLSNWNLCRYLYKSISTIYRHTLHYLYKSINSWGRVKKINITVMARDCSTFTGPKKNVLVFAISEISHIFTGPNNIFTSLKDKNISTDWNCELIPLIHGITKKLYLLEKWKEMLLMLDRWCDTTLYKDITYITY